jgi:hypothetical protein
VESFRRIAPFLAAVLTAALPSTSSAQNWKDSLTSQIEALMARTNTSSDRLRVTKPGTVLVVNKDGISASLGKDQTYLKNHVREGQVQQAGGLAASLANKKTNRDYKVGERVYLTDIDVNDNDIGLRLISLETDQVAVNGNTQQTRYKAFIQFDFPKDSLRTLSFDRVKETIGAVLQVEGAAQPKTIELGQTIAQVEAVMGKPESVLKVGAKTIYVYKAIKVTFIDGKVADIS